MRVAAVLVGLAVAVSVAWLASEQHYDNCIDKARAQFPLGAAGLTAKDKRDSSRSWLEEEERSLFDDTPSAAEERVRDRPLRRRQAALADCSRLPL